MMKFNKVYIMKIVSVIVAVVFMLENTVCAINLPHKTYLRVPMEFNNRQEQKRYLQLQQAVLKIHYNLKAIFTKEESLEMLNKVALQIPNIHSSKIFEIEQAKSLIEQDKTVVVRTNDGILKLAFISPLDAHRLFDGDEIIVKGITLPDGRITALSIAPVFKPGEVESLVEKVLDKANQENEVVAVREIIKDTATYNLEQLKTMLESKQEIDSRMAAATIILRGGMFSTEGGIFDINPTLSRRKFVEILSLTLGVAAVDSFVSPFRLFGAVMSEAVKAVVRWLNNNVVPSTGVIKSFKIPAGQEKKLYESIKRYHGGDTYAAETEAVILRDGVVIYDAAVAGISNTLTGDTKISDKLTNVLWNNRIGSLSPIDSDSDYFEYPGGLKSRYGKVRAFIMRMISAVGKYQTEHPFNPGKGFNWNQYYPVAGENAWACVMNALQAYVAKNGRKYESSAIEFQLAEQIARTAFDVMQVKSGRAAGGIRMAAKGTYSEQDARAGKTGTDQDYWYCQVSTENNLSWYAALRMLWQLTKKQEYKDAMDRVGVYLKASLRYNPNTGECYFVQGMHFDEQTNKWVDNKIFATDCQTWAIDVLGPEVINQWARENFKHMPGFVDNKASYDLWQTTKKRAGIFNEKGDLLALDFTDFREERSGDAVESGEWTLGGVESTGILTDYYNLLNPSWGSECKRDGVTQVAHIESTMKVEDKDGAGYLYSDKRAITAHGWIAAGIPSTASTAWMELVLLRLSPFYLPGEKGHKIPALADIVKEAMAIVNKVPPTPMKKINVIPPRENTLEKTAADIFKNGQKILKGGIGTWGGLVYSSEGSSMYISLDRQNEYGAWEGSLYVDCSKTENWPSNGVIKIKMRGNGEFRLRLLDKQTFDRGWFGGPEGYCNWRKIKDSVISVPLTEFKNTDVSQVAQFVIVIRGQNTKLSVESIQVVIPSDRFGALGNDANAAPLADALWKRLYGTGYEYQDVPNIPGLLPNETFGDIISRGQLLGMVHRLGELDEVTNGYSGTETHVNGQAVTVRHDYITDTQIGIAMDIVTTNYTGTCYAVLDRATGKVTISDSTLQAVRQDIAGNQDRNKIDELRSMLSVTGSSL